MKVCFFSDAQAEHTRRWTKHFAEKGHTVDLITWNPDVLPDYPPVRLHVLKKITGSNGIVSRTCNLFFLLGQTRRIFKDAQPDILHAHSAGAYAWMARAIGFHPYIITPWGNDINIHVKNSVTNKWLTMASLKGADLVTCDAFFIKDEVIRLGAKTQNVEVVMFGVDMSRFPQNKSRDKTLVEKFSLGSHPVIISTRTHWPERDVDCFIRAIPSIVQAVPNAICVVAADGPERSNLEAKATALGVTESVRFTGYLSEEDIVRWLCTSDVYVSTSQTDAGLASSTAEAMACELPVVVSDNSENEIWVHENKGGYLVPNGASNLVAERVIHLLQNKQISLAFGRYNRSLIKERFDFATEMNRMEDIYRSLI